VARDAVVSFDDVELTSDLDVVALRREMETQSGSLAA
jgi:predicted homoserine dehydrogenase-like protein